MKGSILNKSIEEVKDAMDIVKVVERYIPLKQNKACCPFHDEKSPSFTVTPAKGIFKCYGCGKGGDAITFIQEMDNVDFIEAIKILAEMSNISLQYENVTKEEFQKQKEVKKAKDDGYNFMQIVSEWFESQYKENKEVQNYLNKERKISEVTRAKLNIGYADKDFHTLQKHLSHIGKTTEGLKYGLIKEDKHGKLYDVFRDRLIFPIRDEKNNIISFAGRLLSKDRDVIKKYGKYINGSTTPIYSKSTVLYGLKNWRVELGIASEAIITEGYLDVAMAVEKGINHALAVCGTALTPYYIRKIKKFMDGGRLILGMDGDEAGEKSIDNVIQECLKEGIIPEVLNLENGEDLDEFLKKPIPADEKAKPIKKATVKKSK